MVEHVKFFLMRVDEMRERKTFIDKFKLSGDRDVMSGTEGLKLT